MLKDVEEGAILCDSLKNIGFVMSMVLPSDVNQTTAYRCQMEIMLNRTTKPIIFVTYEFMGCKDCMEMAEGVVGGTEALQKNLLVACYIIEEAGPEGSYLETEHTHRHYKERWYPNKTSLS